MERALKIFLRSVGFVAALAAFGVVMPYAWMNDIHQVLGLGVLPDAPIVGYLARSTSAFYALYGGLLWVLSLNLSRYRPLLSCVGIGTILLGVALTGVDRVEGLPFFWQVVEGPFDMAAGTILLLLARSLKEEVSPTIQTRN
jgi:hypothetical protein